MQREQLEKSWAVGVVKNASHCSIISCSSALLQLVSIKPRTIPGFYIATVQELHIKSNNHVMGTIVDYVGYCEWYMLPANMLAFDLLFAQCISFDPITSCLFR